MFQQDYLVQMFVNFARAIRLSWEKANGKEEDPDGAAMMLETVVGTAVNIDGAALLSLAPESIASILRVSDTDPRVIEYIARTLLLEASYLDEDDETTKARLRREQAYAIAHDYGISLLDESIAEEELEAFFEKSLSQDENSDEDADVAAVEDN